MPIAGLVLTFSGTGADSDAVLRTLRGMPGLTLGPRKAGQLAVVLETATVRDQRAVWEELSATPGVAGIQLAYAHLEDPLETETDPKPTHQEVRS